MSDTKKILIVDENSKYLRDALVFHGYEVKLVKDKTQLLKILDKEQFEIVFLDIETSSKENWQTLKKIRKTQKLSQIPIVMLSSQNDEQKILNSLLLGADDYFVKPFILPILLAKTDAIIKRYKRQNQSNKGFNVKNSITPLTNREKEVLMLVSKGANNKEIAEKLILREVTIKSHLNRIFKKLNVKNRTQAVLATINLDIAKQIN